MTNIPSTKSDIASVLSKLSLKNIDDLFKIIPSKFKFDINKLPLKDRLSEQELNTLFLSISNKNLNAANSLCFMGGGSYDHYIPKIIDTLSSRSEFCTSYTPYQAEVSQGTLQYLYEFQSMLCELSGMDVSNASLYDGASAAAEACIMSVNYTHKKKVLVSSMLHPEYIDVIKTYLKPKNIEIVLLENDKGLTSYEDYEKCIDKETAGIVIQSPNYFGLIEDWKLFSKNKDQSLLIGISDPISLSLLESPGKCGCDIYVGEGQPLGNYMEYGGPNIGLLTCKNYLMRKLPGRIIGKTTDVDNSEGYVMVLQTREQHIRRGRATSNICTNQGLLALRCTIYLALFGKEGLPKIAQICYNNAQYAAKTIDKLGKFKIFNKNRSFIKEFVVVSDISSKRIQNDGIKNNILIDRPKYNKNDNLILLAFTEKRTKSEIDTLVNFLSKYE